MVLGAYGGNTLLLGFSTRTGIPLDHLNFVASQVVSLALAPLMQNVFHPSAVKASTRQAFVLIIGLYMGYFAFGMQALHLLCFPTLGYILLNVLSPNAVHRWVMVVALSYLSSIHLHRQMYDSGVYALDVTGPLMVMTQKITSLAFSLHDGLTKEEKELTPNQKRYAVKRVPTLLEFFSYMIHFQTLMAGPMVFYTDYVNFITGENFKVKAIQSNGAAPESKTVVVEPRPFYPAFKKIVASVVCATVFTILEFPIERAKDNDFIQRSVVYQMFYLHFSTNLTRFKYYHAWLLSDAINNISGLGFNGLNEKGEQKWDLITNVDILGFEFAQSLRDCINSWNIVTNSWLRMVVYERVPKSRGVALTFALSALWHGFYPGYYLTFATGALYTAATRVNRKHLRPLFTTSPAKKQMYDIACIIFTRILMSYITFPFVLLEFWSSMRVFWNMYFWLHVVGIGSIYLMPRFLSPGEADLRNRLSKLVSNSNGVNSLHG